MDFEQQKPITDEFRKGWERIYVQQEVRKIPKDWGIIPLTPVETEKQ
jgi:hypothetical protein